MEDQTIALQELYGRTFFLLEISSVSQLRTAILVCTHPRTHISAGTKKKQGLDRLWQFVQLKSVLGKVLALILLRSEVLLGSVSCHDVGRDARSHCHNNELGLLMCHGVNAHNSRYTISQTCS